ncbi:MAG: hypothetical protein OEW64_01330 [Gammaproteobacteria bacterium]|nr:hypothetical protein [Gammaproteobacteria bacterium]MDH5302722.1 hypothetical protein [Gammaproteobacteria bacterium]MDH5321889.1 hypothetical protein [Gammaproteobacteria bacterium]
MEIIYAAEKRSIATLLSEFTDRFVQPDDIEVTEDPNETGSFRIGFLAEHYVMAPDGRIEWTNSVCRNW